MRGWKSFWLLQSLLLGLSVAISGCVLQPVESYEETEEAQAQLDEAEAPADDEPTADPSDEPDVDGVFQQSASGWDGPQIKVDPNPVPWKGNDSNTK